MVVIDPYKNFNSSYPKEIDLREELEDTLFGSVSEISKGRKGLLRKMRRDSSGNLISCACRDKITNEPSKDFHCPYCKGFGFYWDEYKIIYFRNEESYSREKGKNNEYVKDYFYLQHTVDITDNDYIILVNLDKDGEISSPVERIKYFKIFSADSFRSDNGRIEYWRIRAQEERKWSVWYDVKQYQ